MEIGFGAPEKPEEAEPMRKCAACGHSFDVTFAVMLNQACPACGAVIEEELCTDDVGELFP